MPIKYTINVLDELKRKGFTTYYIRKEKIFSEGTVQKFRNNDTNITLSNIETLCKILNRQPSDIVEYIPDDNTKIGGNALINLICFIALCIFLVFGISFVFTNAKFPAIIALVALSSAFVLACLSTKKHKSH